MVSRRSNPENYQSIKTGNINARGNVKITQSIQNENIKLSPAVQDFISQMQVTASNLEKVQDQHEDIQEAVLELRSAIAEAKSSRASQLRIRSAFFTAIGFLESATAVIAKSTTLLQAIDAVNSLIPQIKSIFS